MDISGGHIFRLIRTFSIQSHFFTSKIRLHRNARRFLPHLRGRVLDVGAGKQPYRIYLKDSVEYLSMDITAMNSPDVVGSLLDMKFPPEMFDAVICTEVLEHVPDPIKALRNINRVLKPGGLLYLTAPMTWGLHYEPSDYFRFTKYGIEWLLNQSGLATLEILRMGGLFTMILARLEDVGMSILYRTAFPLKFIIGHSNRVFLVSIAMFPFIALLDCLAAFLDLIIPRANEDALGWAVLAKKRKPDQ